MTVARRLKPFGESVFATMSRLALEHGAVNLGQGFPDFDPPTFVREAAKQAIDQGFCQYGRSAGLLEVTRALAPQLKQTTGNSYDPEREITVTAGCTETIAAALLGLLDPGDEVIMFDPSYDSYAACVAMAGGVARRIALRGPTFRIEETALREVASPRTRIILLNSPHNPTGRIFDEAELRAVARLAQERNIIVISDEVYEQITFARAHLSIASLSGMAERTLVLSSLGKTYSCTGWKIGWAAGPSALNEAVRAAHQFLTFCCATPLQSSAVGALASGSAYQEQLRRDYGVRRQIALEELRSAGFTPIEPEGSYFIVAPITHLGLGSDTQAAEALVREARVATIPVSAFCAEPAQTGLYLRFAFCKQEATLREAGRRLRAWTAQRPARV